MSVGLQIAFDAFALFWRDAVPPPGAPAASQAMHPEDIKAAMRKQGVSPAALSRHLGVTVQTVSSVVRGVITSAPVANAIAKVCGIPVNQLWPGRYDAEPDEPARVAALLGARTRAPNRSRKAA